MRLTHWCSLAFLIPNLTAWNMGLPLPERIVVGMVVGGLFAGVTWGIGSLMGKR